MSLSVRKYRESRKKASQSVSSVSAKFSTKRLKAFKEKESQGEFSSVQCDFLSFFLFCWFLTENTVGEKFSPQTKVEYLQK